jgi:HK97 family phage prohead protease
MSVAENLHQDSPIYDFVKKEISSFEGKSLMPIVNTEERTIEGIISTVLMDRDGEVVLPSAFERDLDSYFLNPILLLFHGHKTLPVGKCLDIRITPENVWAKFEIAPTETGNEVLTLVKGGFLRGFSAGFVPIEAVDSPSPSKVPSVALKTSLGKPCKRLYSRVELVEISLLSIPSNRNALIDLAEKGNSVAGIIVKSFDKSEEDITDLVSAWLVSKGNETIERKPWLGFDIQDDLKNKLAKIQSDLSIPKDKRINKDSFHVTLRYFKEFHSESKEGDLYRAIQHHLSRGMLSSYLLEGVDYSIFDKNTLVARYKNGNISELHERLKAILNTSDFDESFPFLDAHITLAENYTSKAPSGVPPSGKTNSLRFRGTYFLDKIINPNAALLKGLISDIDFGEKYSLKCLCNDVKCDFGLSSMVIKKMTTEEFEENEHPRASDGKFTDKKGGGTTKKKVDKTESANKVSKSKIDKKVAKAKPTKTKTDSPYSKEKIGVLRRNKKELAKNIDKLKKEGYDKESPEVKKVISEYEEVSGALNEKEKKSEKIREKIKEKKHQKNIENIIVASVAVLVGAAFAVRDIKKIRRLSKQKFNFNFEDEGFSRNFGGRFHDRNGFRSRTSGENFKSWERKAKEYNEARVNSKAFSFFSEEGWEDLGKMGMERDFKKWESGFTGNGFRAKRNEETWKQYFHKANSHFDGQSGRQSGRQSSGQYRNQQRDQGGGSRARNFNSGRMRYSNENYWSKKSEKIFETLELRLSKVKSNHIHDLFKENKDLAVRELQETKATIGIIKRKREDLSKDSSNEGKKYLKYVDQVISESEKAISDLEKKYGFKSKQVEIDIIIKAMTAEEFEESEHPRASDGKFTSSGKGSGTSSSKSSKPNAPKPDKGRWGGVRKGAGRVPKDPIEAKAKLERRFRSQNPEASNEEINQKIIDHAIEKRKPDLLSYVKDPVAYQKERDQQLLERAAASYKKVKRGGTTIEEGRNSRDTYASLDGIKNSESKWNRAVKESKSIDEAIKTFKKEDAGESEKTQGKVVIAAATIASAIGFAAIMRGRPSFKNIDALRSAGGAGREAANIAKAEFFSVVSKKKTQDAVGLEKIATSVIEKLGIKKVGKNEVVRFGPKIKGYGPNSPYKIDGNYKKIVRGDDYIPKAGDKDTDSAYFLFTENGPSLRGIAVSSGVIPKKPGLKTVSKKVGGVSSLEELEKHGLTVASTKNSGNIWNVKDPEKFKNFLKEKNILNESTKNAQGKLRVDEIEIEIGGKKVRHEVSKKHLSKDISALWTKEEKEIKNLILKNASENWHDYMDEKVWGLISRKVLATLTATTSTTGLYYFQKDIEESITDVKRFRKNDLSEDEKIAKILSQMNKEEKTSRSDLDIERAKAKAELAKAKRLEREAELERERRFSKEEKDSASEDTEKEKPKMKVHKGGVDPTEEDIFAAQHQRQTNKNKAIDSKKIISKEMSAQEEDVGQMDLEEFTSLIAIELSDMFEDSSQICKTAIESGIPGHTDFEISNEQLTELYAFMKDKADEYEEDELLELEPDIEEKGLSLDSIDIAKDDKSEVRLGTQQKCSKCGKIADEVVVSNCDDPSCPYTFLESIEIKREV